MNFRYFALERRVADAGNLRCPSSEHCDKKQFRGIALLGLATLSCLKAIRGVLHLRTAIADFFRLDRNRRAWQSVTKAKHHPDYG